MTPGKLAEEFLKLSKREQADILDVLIGREFKPKIILMGGKINKSELITLAEGINEKSIRTGK